MKTNGILLLALLSVAACKAEPPTPEQPAPTPGKPAVDAEPEREHEEGADTLTLAGVVAAATDYFAGRLEGRGGDLDSLAASYAVSWAGVDSVRQAVWGAWRAANGRLSESKLPAPPPLYGASPGQWFIPDSMERNAVMRYYYGSKNAAAGQTLPLIVHLHGSGAPDSEWSAGRRLALRSYGEEPSAYFVPRIPNTGDLYRWWQRGKQWAWEKLLRQVLAGDDIDPLRIYFVGISEGGYGSQRLASFYADYLAGAGPMAGGEPLINAPVENCANTAFSLLTGSQDDGFCRNTLTRNTGEAFDKAQGEYGPLATDGETLFRHRVELIAGAGHGIDYSLTMPWLRASARDPRPKVVLWEDFAMDGRRRGGFHNLWVERHPTSPDAGGDRRTLYKMVVRGNAVEVSVDNVSYSVAERDPRWGIGLRYDRAPAPASGGRLRIYLDERMVDARQDVVVTVNGREAWRGRLVPTVADMAASAAAYFDPGRVFAASVVVDY